MKVKTIFLSCTAAIAGGLLEANAFSNPVNMDMKRTETSLHQQTSRRQIFNKSAAAVLSIATADTILSPNAAYAASSKFQEKTDKENIVKGYKRLEYLLDNWEKETTICGRTDNPYIGCERTPEKVMVYLGFKSMDDPLFRADKTLFRLQSLVSPDDEIDYMEAMELFNEKSEEASNTAFISSWGEANPGGGKDRVELFIERSRKQIVTAKDSLGKVIKILGLEV